MSKDTIKEEARAFSISKMTDERAALYKLWNDRGRPIEHPFIDCLLADFLKKFAPGKYDAAVKSKQNCLPADDSDLEEMRKEIQEKVKGFLVDSSHFGKAEATRMVDFALQINKEVLQENAYQKSFLVQNEDDAWSNLYRQDQEIKKIFNWVKDFKDLVEGSEGITGWHQNGEILTWEQTGLLHILEIIEDDTDS